MPRSSATSTPANRPTLNPPSQADLVADESTASAQPCSIVNLTLSDSQSVRSSSRPPSQRTRIFTERSQILESEKKKKNAKSKKSTVKKAQRARRRLTLVVSSPDYSNNELQGNAMSDVYSEGTSAAHEEGSEAGELQAGNPELDNIETQYIDRQQLLHDLAEIAGLDVETCQFDNYEVMEVLRAIRNAPDTQAPPNQTREQQTLDVVLPSAQLNQGSGSGTGANSATVPGSALKRRLSAQVLRADSAKRSRVQDDPNNTDTVSESDDESPRPIPYAQRTVIRSVALNRTLRPTTAAPPVSSPVTVHANELLGSSEWQPIDLRSDRSLVWSSRASSIAPTSRAASQPPVGRSPAPSQSHSLGSSIEHATAATRPPPPRTLQDADAKSDSASDSGSDSTSDSDSNIGSEPGTNPNIPSSGRSQVFFGPARRRFRAPRFNPLSDSTKNLKSHETSRDLTSQRARRHSHGHCKPSRDCSGLTRSHEIG